MDPLGLRADGSSDGVTASEKGFHDVDGHESVRASDENFSSLSNGGHVSGGTGERRDGKTSLI